MIDQQLMLAELLAELSRGFDRALPGPDVANRHVDAASALLRKSAALLDDIVQRVPDPRHARIELSSAASLTIAACEQIDSTPMAGHVVTANAELASVAWYVESLSWDRADPTWPDRVTCRLAR